MIVVWVLMILLSFEADPIVRTTYSREDCLHQATEQLRRLGALNRPILDVSCTRYTTPRFHPVTGELL